MILLRLRFLWIPGVAILALAHGPRAAAQTPASQPAAAGVTWLTSLDAGYLQSQRLRQPMLVMVDDPADQASRRMLDSVEKAVASEPADQWVFVRLHWRDAKDAVRTLGVATPPAIRLVSLGGRVAAARDGEISAAQLIEWLKNNRPATIANPPAEASSRRQNLSDLASADEATREQAVRRLAADRDAAGDVVRLFLAGSMTARLAALDLLEQWGAPIQGIDPWDSSTLTDQRRQSLLAWAGAPIGPATRPTTASAASADRLASADVELDALLNAANDIDARAVREQMTHFGPDILPLVDQRLARATSDANRQRLLALRYRLAATDELAEQWPSGFDRLASIDPFVRRAAVDELAKIATSHDSRLLVELFSDDDEFVRERSLRMLRSVGGAETNKALMSLLKDPEPNVRAAVLKTLAEQPDPSLAGDLAAYVAGEKDPDLVVHCIHVLQDIPGDQAVDCLKGLLAHPQWRVRAEACQAIYQKMQARQAMDAAQIARLIPALGKCLDDSDSFVTSQAALALIGFNLPAAFDVVKAGVDRHPALAIDVLAAIGRDNETTLVLLPVIRKLVFNPQAQIRAAAIRAVCRVAPKSAGLELKAGLEDSDLTVRQAAATSLVVALEEMFPGNGTLWLEPGNYSAGQRSVEIQQWIKDFRAGPERPQWMSMLQPDLERLLASDDEQTRVSVAVALLEMGEVDKTWPVLLKSAGSELSRSIEAAALPWLDWDKRKELWDRLVVNTSDQQMPKLIENFVTLSDPQAAPVLWDLLRDPPHDEWLREVHDALAKLYGIGGTTYSYRMVDGESVLQTKENKRLTAEAAPMLEKGGELQKLEAMILMLQSTPEVVVKQGRAIAENKKNGVALRGDAFRLVLMALPENQADPLAAAEAADPVLRKVALPYLVLGTDAIRYVRESVYLNGINQSNRQESYGGMSQNDPIIHVYVPAGLQAAAIQDMMADPDVDMAGYAGYLVAILGDKRGLEPLLKAARSHGLDDNSWGKLVYRAIAKLDDDSRTPVLEEIYKAYGKENWEMREFYWTIRAMHGPNILNFRKKMRDEVGMQILQ